MTQTPAPSTEVTIQATNQEPEPGLVMKGDMLPVCLGCLAMILGRVNCYDRGRARLPSLKDMGGKEKDDSTYGVGMGVLINRCIPIKCPVLSTSMGVSTGVQSAIVTAPLSGQ